MKNPYENHANWLVQNDRHGKTSVEGFIKSFNIPENKQELFKKRLEFLCHIIFEEGEEQGKIEHINKFRELCGLEIEKAEFNPHLDF